MPDNIIKIAVTGPESTGKSDLSQFLSEYFNEPFAAEYAREYLHRNPGSYTLQDIEEICKGQIKLEEMAMAEARDLCFFDTEMLVLKIWSKFRFGTVPQIIEENNLIRHYDLYLLCNNDLPWTVDPLRESPEKEERDLLYALYKQELEEKSVPFVEVGGVGEERKMKALKAVEDFLDEIK